MVPHRIGVEPADTRFAAPKPVRPGAADRLKDACRQFEAVFLAQLLKESFKSASVLSGSVPGKGVYGALATQAFAKALSAGPGMGIGRMLYESLSKSGALRSQESLRVEKPEASEKRPPVSAGLG